MDMRFLLKMCQGCFFAARAMAPQLNGGMHESELPLLALATCATLNYWLA